MVQGYLAGFVVVVDWLLTHEGMDGGQHGLLFLLESLVFLELTGEVFETFYPAVVVVFLDLFGDEVQFVLSELLFVIVDPLDSF